MIGTMGEGKKIFSHYRARKHGPGKVIDIRERGLPLIVCLGSCDLQYLIEGSHDGQTFFNLTKQAIMGQAVKDLIPSIRFWRTNIVGGRGRLTSYVGPIAVRQ